jgi:hypothetical protein
MLRIDVPPDTVGESADALRARKTVGPGDYGGGERVRDTMAPPAEFERGAKGADRMASGSHSYPESTRVTPKPQ